MALLQAHTQLLIQAEEDMAVVNNKKRLVNQAVVLVLGLVTPVIAKATNIKHLFTTLPTQSEVAVATVSPHPMAVARATITIILLATAANQVEIIKPLIAVAEDPAVPVTTGMVATAREVVPTKHHTPARIRLPIAAPIKLLIVVVMLPLILEAPTKHPLTTRHIVAVLIKPPPIGHPTAVDMARHIVDLMDLLHMVHPLMALHPMKPPHMALHPTQLHPMKHHHHIALHPTQLPSHNKIS